MPYVAVVIGGGALHPSAVAAVPDDAVVFAADSGLDHAVAAGLTPTVLVGDMDSISSRGRMWAYANGVDIREASPDKDQTDTELALACAMEVDDLHGILLLAGQGDRLDHLLGTLLALGHPSLAPAAHLSAYIGATSAVLVRDRVRAVPIDAGRTFSVLALHGAVEGLTVRGGRWELQDDRLGGHESRGVSNVAVDDEIRVSAAQGVVTVVVPA